MNVALSIGLIVAGGGAGYALGGERHRFTAALVGIGAGVLLAAALGGGSGSGGTGGEGVSGGSGYSGGLLIGVGVGGGGSAPAPIPLVIDSSGG
jgi:hypothetical protein